MGWLGACFGGSEKAKSQSPMNDTKPQHTGGSSRKATQPQPQPHSAAVDGVAGASGDAARSNTMTLSSSSSTGKSHTERSYRRREAVHQGRTQSIAPSSERSKDIIERRLPRDGGPPAQRAHNNTNVIAKACDDIALFKNLAVEDRQLVYSNMYQLRYSPDERIIKEGEDGRNFYVLVEGSVVVSVHDEKQGGEVDKKTLSPGETFGEVALLYSCPRSANVRASSHANVTVWAIDRVTFKELLSEAAYKRRKRYIELLSKVSLFQGLNEYDRAKLADAVQTSFHKPGDTIIEQDNLESSQFYIITKGECVVYLPGKSEEVKRLGEGDYFGEVAILEEMPPTASVVASTDVTSIKLDRASFVRLIGGSAIKTVLKEGMDNYVFSDDRSGHGTSHGDRDSLSSRKDKFNEIAGGRDPPPSNWTDDLKLDDLVAIKEIGRGLTATVYLCKLRDSKQTTSVCKLMRKSRIVSKNQVSNVIREKQLLESLQCPFLTSYYDSTQDERNLYLFMEHVAGGDLFTLLADKKRFDSKFARFYAAEVLLALEYLHIYNYACRDVKPENVLIDSQGHTKVADLGFTKHLERGERTYTTCGTTDYMAPEVILSQGHNKAVDYWAFSVLVYEMLTGQAPFEGSSHNHKVHRILTADLIFPDDFPLPAKDLVSRMCVVDVSRRMGTCALVMRADCTGMRC